MSKKRPELPQYAKGLGLPWAAQTIVRKPNRSVVRKFFKDHNINPLTGINNKNSFGNIGYALATHLGARTNIGYNTANHPQLPGHEISSSKRLDKLGILACAYAILAGQGQNTAQIEKSLIKTAFPGTPLPYSEEDLKIKLNYDIPEIFSRHKKNLPMFR